MSQFNPAMPSKLVGSYKLTPVYWDKSLIVFDTATNTLKITGHNLTDGTKVVFVSFTGRSNDFTSGALMTGKIYYVRQVSGISFKISTDNTDANIIALPSWATGQGSVQWRLEKVTDIGSITITGMNIKNSARIVVRNGGLNSTFAALNFSFNEVEDANTYYYVNSSAAGIGAKMYLHHYGTAFFTKIRAIVDVYCRGNMIVAAGEFGFDGGSSANGSPLTGSNTSSNGESKVDSRFSSINSITVSSVGTFFGDLTVEVYGE